MKLKNIILMLEKQGYGKDNSNWKGDQVKERARHYRIEQKYGKASEGTCSKCGSKKNLEWATLKNGKMRRMCRSCHSEYDNKSENFKKEK